MNNKSMSQKKTGKATKPTSNKKPCGIIVLTAIATIILLSTGAAIFYVIAGGLNQSNEDTSQAINNIYATMTMEASLKERSIELTASAPDNSQEPIALPKNTPIPSQTPAPTNTQASQSPLLSPQPPDTQTSVPCDCSKLFICSDFSSQDNAQACFFSCGGSAVNNWSDLDSDHDGNACKSLTYP